jgi:hypothetical protein
MAAFLIAGGNPNGWEIVCALYFTTTLLVHKEEILGQRLGLRSMASISIAGLLVATARSSSAAWLIMIFVVFAIWFRVWRLRRSRLLLTATVIPGVAFGLVWNVLFPAVVKAGQPVSGMSIGSFFSYLALSFQDLSVKFAEPWGVLGWLDTWPSEIVVIGVVIALLYFLPVYAPTRRHRALLVAIIAMVFLSSASLEAIGWSSWVGWWQGRYSLVPLVGLSLLLFSNPGRREPSGLFALAAWMTLGNVYMVCLNYWRYAYGVANGFPSQMRINEYGSPIMIYSIAVVMLLMSAVLFVADRAYRVERNEVTATDLYEKTLLS